MPIPDKTCTLDLSLSTVVCTPAGGNLLSAKGKKIKWQRKTGKNFEYRLSFWPTPVDGYAPPANAWPFDAPEAEPASTGWVSGPHWEGTVRETVEGVFEYRIDVREEGQVSTLDPIIIVEK